MSLPTPGTEFNGRYDIGRVLGQGGFATVYQAYDRNSQRDVALKVIDPGEGRGGDELLQRFRREVRIIANLRDPHTVTMFDSGQTEDGLLFFAFEFIEGHDLADVLENGGPLSEDVTRHVLAQVLSSLREAHALGLLHRDIKPANIRLFEYLGDPYYTKVLDFGIAREIEAEEERKITHDGALVGTPHFMAPEQLRATTLTPATDIYAVGLVAYEMLTGESAATGRTLPEVAMSHMSPEPFRLPASAAVSPAMRNVIERMIAKAPAARFQSAEEVLEALEQLTPLAAPRPAAPERPSAAARAGAPPTLHEPPASPSGTESDSAAGTALMTVGALLVSGLLAFGLISILASDDGDDSVTDADKMVLEAPAVDDLGTFEHGEPAAMKDPSPPEVERAISSAASELQGALFGSGCWRDAAGARIYQSKFGEYSWETRLPFEYDPGHAYPVVVLVPDTNQGMTGTFPTTSGFGPVALQEGAILISASLAVPAFESDWPNERGAIEFLGHAISSATEKHCVDAERVYLVGHGRGGQLVETARCHLPVAAIGTTAWRTTSDQVANCAEEPVPFIHFAGRRDTYNPIDGGNSCLGPWRPPLAEKEAVWRRANGCSSDESVVAEGEEFRCTTWDCEAPFVSCVHSGGYALPHESATDGARRLMVLFPRCQFIPAEFDLAAQMWTFLSAQTRGARSVD